jgi:hypothetical protein
MLRNFAAFARINPTHPFCSAQASHHAPAQKRLLICSATGANGTEMFSNNDLCDPRIKALDSTANLPGRNK